VADNAAARRYRGNVGWVRKQNDSRRLPVGPASLMPGWTGEKLDLDWIVSLIPAPGAPPGRLLPPPDP
jgi:hypothetical protein